MVVKREHATYHATFLAWPLVILGIRTWSEPLITLFTVTWLAMFVIFIWAIYKIERSLIDEGKSLFYPWRVPSPKKKGLRVDNALRHALQGLADCESTVMIAWRLETRTKDGKLVPEAARGSYDKAVARLENATGLEPDERWRVLDEAMKWLWAARAEVLREMVR